MAIQIILTDIDADDYIVLMGSRAAERELRRTSEKTFDTPLTKEFTTVDLQKEIDAHWASQGVNNSEILTDAEQSKQIIEDINSGKVVLPNGDVSVELNTELLFGAGGATRVTFHQAPGERGVAEAALFERMVGEPVHVTIPGAFEVGSSAGKFPEYKEPTNTQWLHAGSVVLVNSPAPPVVIPAGPPAIVAIPPTLDKDGFPWDARIHSGTKSVNKDGTWRTKKNLHPALLTLVTAELKQLMAIPSGQQTLLGVPPPPVVALTAAQAMQVLPVIPNVPVFPVASSVAGSIPVPPPPPAAADTGAAVSFTSGVPLPPVGTVTTASPISIPVPPPPAVAHASNVPAGYTADPARPGIFLPPTLGFGELLFKVTQAIGAGQVTDARVKEICMAAGLPGGNLALIQSRPDLIPGVARELGFM